LIIKGIHSLLRSSGRNLTLNATDTDQRFKERVAARRTRHARTPNFSVAARAVLCSIQEGKITVVGVSIEAMVAKKKGERDGETT